MTDMYCLTTLEARSLKSRCQQGWLLQKIMREGFVLFPLLVGDFLVHVSSDHLFLCILVYVQISPFHKGISHIGLGPILKSSF